MTTQRRLGRGLAALLGDDPAEQTPQPPPEQASLSLHHPADEEVAATDDADAPPSSRALPDLGINALPPRE